MTWDRVAAYVVQPAMRTALALSLALVLTGCATRPGPEVLTPAAPAPGAKLSTIFVATTRARDPKVATVFTEARSDTLRYARYVISIPPVRRGAEIVWQSEGRPDPTHSFTTISATPLTEAEFVSGVAAAAGSSSSGRGGVAVFVHGYNYSFQESLFRLAQMNADVGAGGSAILFAWPSAATVSGYVEDKESATFSRDELAHVLSRLAAANKPKSITLIGHSMGAWLSVEALRQLTLAREGRTVARLKDVVLAAPDIDVDVFRKQLSVIGKLSPPLTVLVSKDDKALSIARLLAGDKDRLGAADIDRPIVREAAQRYGVRVIDISELQSENGSNHDRYASLAALYPKFKPQIDGSTGIGALTGGVSRLGETAAAVLDPLSH